MPISKYTSRMYAKEVSIGFIYRRKTFVESSIGL